MPHPYDALRSAPPFTNEMFEEVWTEIFDFARTNRIPVSHQACAHGNLGCVAGMHPSVARALPPSYLPLAPTPADVERERAVAGPGKPGA